MPPPDDVVSPELALVDPALAERARTALVVEAALRLRAAAEPSSVAPPPREDRRRTATPALTLLATAAASLVVTAFTDSESASGEPPVSARPEATSVRGSDVTAESASSGRSASTPAAATSAPTEVRPSSKLAAAVTGRGAETAPERVLTEARPGSSPALVATDRRTLVWPHVSDAGWYDIELRRGGTVVYASRSPSARLAVPGSWERNGVRYAIQPEDQVFVWPVVDGGRAAPIVDGVLVLDATLVARLIAETRANP